MRSLPIAALLALPLALLPAQGALAEARAGLPWEDGKPKEVSAVPGAGSPFLEAGRKIYHQRCVPCHGVRGKGDGPAADYLDPRPRDFTSGQFKFRTTRSGELPTDGDLFRVVTRGVPGTAMPAWGEGVFRLSETQRWQVVYFVKHLGRDFWNPDFDPYGKTSDGRPRIVIIPEPPRTTARLLARGKELYLDRSKGACVKCHGKFGRGDGSEAATLKDDRGDRILPTDQSRPWQYRNGASVKDIFRTFTTGLNGTPMPSFDKTIQSDEDRWSLAMYVASLQEEPPEKQRGPLDVRRHDGAIPDDPASAAWGRATPYRLWLAGQLVASPRWANPAVDLVEVRALYDDDEIALLFAWDDRFEDEGGDLEEPHGDIWQPKDSYVPVATMRERTRAATLQDQLAIHFPTAKAAGGRAEKPYVFMGDPGHRMNAWHWRAGWNEAVEVNSAGAASSYVSQAAGSQATRAKAAFASGRWQLLIRRPLRTRDPKIDVQFEPGAIVPFTLRVWDGAAGEWGLQSSMSSWHYLRLETRTPPMAWLYAIAAAAVVALLEVASVRWLRRTVTTASAPDGQAERAPHSQGG